MSNFLFRSSLFLAILLSAVSCKKDTANEPESLPLNTITVTVDGQKINTAVAAGVLSGEPDVARLFTIILADGGEEPLGISFILSNGATLEQGNYADCEDFPDVCLNIMSGVYNSSLTGGPGNAEVNFSSLDFRSGGSAIGTFSGTLSDAFGDTKEIKDGQFNVSIL